jgi:hypothetical protein
MPLTRVVNAARLEFRGSNENHVNLSGAAVSDGWLWIVGDETSHIERLRWLDPVGSEAWRFGDARTFPLGDLLDLPGAADGEADLEGMAVAAGYLWVVGSHGLKRKNVKPGRDDAENSRRLAKLSLDENRRLLARVPIEVGADGQPELVRTTKDGRCAARLQGGARANQLTDLLDGDLHLAPFMAIPGKDNGFDIEGLATDGKRLFLGLRGPVLRGWSTILEIAVDVRRESLHLMPLDDRGLLLRKHFLPLDGLGIRDLHFHGDDLFILAGPTMTLDGDIRMYRWQQARAALAASTGPAVFPAAPVRIATLPHGIGSDRAEAICALPSSVAGDSPAWLVLYDAPDAGRQDGKDALLADLLPFS